MNIIIGQEKIVQIIDIHKSVIQNDECREIDEILQELEIDPNKFTKE